MIIIITFAGWCQCWRCQCLPLHREHAPQHHSTSMILALFLEIDQFWSLHNLYSYLWVSSTNLPQLYFASNQLRLRPNLAAKAWTIWGSIPPWGWGAFEGAKYQVDYNKVKVDYKKVKMFMRKWKLIIRKWKWIIKITMVLSIQAGLPSLMKGTKCPMAATVKFFLCTGLEQEDRTLLIVELIDSWRKIISNH